MVYVVNAKTLFSTGFIFRKEDNTGSLSHRS